MKEIKYNANGEQKRAYELGHYEVETIARIGKSKNDVEDYFTELWEKETCEFTEPDGINVTFKDILFVADFEMLGELKLTHIRPYLLLKARFLAKDDYGYQTQHVVEIEMTEWRHTTMYLDSLWQDLLVLLEEKLFKRYPTKEETYEPEPKEVGYHE